MDNLITYQTTSVVQIKGLHSPENKQRKKKALKKIVINFENCLFSFNSSSILSYILYRKFC